MGIERISAALLISAILGGCSASIEIDAAKTDGSLEFTGHYPRILDYKNPSDIVISYAKADDRHNPRTGWIDKGGGVYHKIYYVAWCPGPHNPLYPAKDVNELPRLIVLRERINYLPNERKNDLPQQVTKHDGRKT